MALIVAARFETFDAAKTAAASLMNAGVTADNLHTFFVNPAGSHNRYAMGGDRAADPDSRGAPSSTLGMAALCGVGGALIGVVITSWFDLDATLIAAAAGVGAYVGSLAGAMRGLGHARPPRNPEEQRETLLRKGHPSGVLLAAHVGTEDERRIALLLRDAGGVEVERARGTWRNGQWDDFDPLATPEPERNL
ncbi:hypothetical protein GSY71_03525 [Pusillimonas sp. TS35]|uniref:hypothetical protein n=1 Tax=Paracandidimonas lactea TaxID=2895524 RepID=UPI00136B34C0|nr:hypothetical protein [Paracandidimonas lactea]MYN12222.1 hypothetical protein [Pusillimonas sp. TS35]